MPVNITETHDLEQEITPLLQDTGYNNEVIVRALVRVAYNIGGRKALAYMQKVIDNA